MKRRYVVSYLTRLITAALLILLAVLSAVYIVYEHEWSEQNAARQRVKLENYVSLLAAQMKAENEKLLHLADELTQPSALDQPDPLLRFNEKQRLYRRMELFLSYGAQLDCLMIQGGQSLLLSNAESCTIQERNAVYHYVRQTSLPVTSSRQQTHWELITVGERLYLMGSYQVNGRIVASWRALDRLLDFSSLSDAFIMELAVTDETGEVLLTQGADGRLQDGTDGGTYAAAGGIGFCKRDLKTIRRGAAFGRGLAIHGADGTGEPRKILQKADSIYIQEEKELKER